MRWWWKPKPELAQALTRAQAAEVASQAQQDTTDDGDVDTTAIEAELTGQWRNGGAAAFAATLRRRLDLAPADDALALHLAAARVYRAHGQIEAARAAFDEAIGHAPMPGRIQFEIAGLALAQHDLATALDCLQLAVTWCPNHAEAWLDLGEVLLKLDRPQEAREALGRSRELLIAARPVAEREAEATLGVGAGVPDGARPDSLLRCDIALSNACVRRGDFAAAQKVLQETVQWFPTFSEAWMALGHAGLLLDDDATSIAAYERAITLVDSPSPALLLHHGVACQQSGLWKLARERFAAVVQDHPTHAIARWYLCQVELALGHWTQGWALFGSRFTSGALSFRAMPFKPWNGEPAPDATLLVLADEGIGDEIMYASCLDAAIARVGHCVVECEPRLARLFERSFPKATVVGSDRSADLSWLHGLPVPEFQISSGDLPRIFRPDVGAFEPRRVYLRLDTPDVEHWKALLSDQFGAGLKIGISWRGGTVLTRARARSLPLQAWKPIFDVPGCHFVSLQYGDVRKDLQHLETLLGRQIGNYPEIHADYDDTAALVGALDLVISVCTAVVHLGGALGKPVWVLAPHSPGWRYGAHAEDMPWYPSVAVRRQPAAGDWDSVCQSVSVGLRQMTKIVDLGTQIRSSPPVSGETA